MVHMTPPASGASIEPKAPSIAAPEHFFRMPDLNPRASTLKLGIWLKVWGSSPRTIPYLCRLLGDFELKLMGRWSVKTCSLSILLRVWGEVYGLGLKIFTPLPSRTIISLTTTPTVSFSACKERRSAQSSAPQNSRYALNPKGPNA